MTSGALWAFLVASLVVVVIPGPSVTFIVGRALAHGRGTAVATALGNAAGAYVVAACVAFGLGSVVQRSAAVFTVVKLAGAGYLIWLGVKAIRHRHELTVAAGPLTSPRPPLRAVSDGFIVGVANPKAVILFGAILPQFVNRAAGHVPAQMLLLGLLAVTIGLASDTSWALAASGVRAWFARSPRRLAMVGGAGGLAMIGLGVAVAATGRKS